MYSVPLNTLAADPFLHGMVRVFGSLTHNLSSSRRAVDTLQRTCTDDVLLKGAI